ncbi:GNAT family N-acetyltransferase [Timonella sp. A28]|uniref:GNAT family N-acetyltransferase n=1 Tax=Timonella sp. A28 TaxID=3442640 RepID=UPI003EBD7D25
MKETHISQGFAEEERNEVGSIYWEAFHKKFRHAFPNHDIGKSAIQQAMSPDHVLVARTDGKVSGVCGFYENGTGALDLSWALLTQLMPTSQALKAALVLGMLSRNEKKPILVLDGICVSSTHRSLGIGSALLAATIERARNTNQRAVRLSVINTNPRAEALYRREGFQPTTTRALGPFSRLYGFTHYTIMEKPTHS